MLREYLNAQAYDIKIEVLNISKMSKIVNIGPKKGSAYLQLCFLGHPVYTNIPPPFLCNWQAYFIIDCNTYINLN